MNIEKIEFLQGKLAIERQSVQNTQNELIKELLLDEPDLNTALIRIAKHAGEVIAVKYHYDHTKELIEKNSLSKLCSASLMESRHYVEKLIRG